MLLYIFTFSVCDNCTLSLLDHTDKISHILEVSFKNVDLSGIPAPWLMLDSFDIRANALYEKYTTFNDAKDGIESFNTITLQKMELLSEQEHLNSIVIKKYSSLNASKIINFLTKSKAYQNEIMYMKDDILKSILNINNYGNTNNFLNLPSALNQAGDYLNFIESYNNDLSNIKQKMLCATFYYDKFDFLNSDLDKTRYEILKLMDRMKLFNRQIHDIGHISENILEDHSEIRDILTHVDNLYSHFIDDKSLVKSLLNELKSYTNKNFNAEAKNTLSRINESLQKMNIIAANLEDIREPTNKSLHLNNEMYKQVRKHWLPKAWKHANRLTEKALKYENLFKPTKDASQMALRAR